ncbi:MAG: glycine--tRNA ligase subunit beta [Thiotrichales bacterium]|jgi:glycyl-tRNA synthetase beta chain|nr:glycine--tRNA ligase subunit beta [Thiotrichales bacterium]
MSQDNTTADLFFELGTEELPPKSLQNLSEALGREVETTLQRENLSYSKVTIYAAPRRLALWIEKLQSEQKDSSSMRRGPAVAAAFDADGNPSKAVTGFARSCGVDVDQLERIETEKGVWMGYQVTTKGAKTIELLPSILEGALERLPIPKRMRWGDSNAEFLRPVHWVVALLGKDIIPMKLYGIDSSNQSQGHRFHNPENITISSGENYATELKHSGKVIVDFALRKEQIREQVMITADELGGVAIIDPDLLNEVTALVEWPVAVSGSFDKSFLEVPQEALIASMQGHQKFFPIVEKSKDGNQGILMAHFITISNIESRNPEMVKSGNERVIRPRLADAAFFWNEDLKNSLESHQDGLSRVVYQDKLGSLLDKSQRVADLAETIASQLGYNLEYAKRAALLGKCDLLTNMVKEFPELQGTMGQYYAENNQEDKGVSVAISEQYLPRFSGDTLPISETGRVLALAERIDSLVGIFGIGIIPTGDKDPFALRRAALGLLRILIENGVSINILEIIKKSVATYSKKDISLEAETADKVFNFVLERLRSYYSDKQISPAIFESVLSCQPESPLDFDFRIAAVNNFIKQDEAVTLSAANKRIHNLLKKSGQVDDGSSTNRALNEALFEESAERELALKLEELRKDLDSSIERSDYSGALTLLATLHKPVDNFFEKVMVMSDDDAIRNNRLALLTQLRNQFLRIADISLLHS